MVDQIHATKIVAATARGAPLICNDVDARRLIVLIMAVSFFGNGRRRLGLGRGFRYRDPGDRRIGRRLVNTFGNISSITTPIIIGYIIQGTGSINGALVFVAANALVAILSYVVIVPEIKRVELGRPSVSALV